MFFVFTILLIHLSTGEKIDKQEDDNIVFSMYNEISSLSIDKVIEKVSIWNKRALSTERKKRDSNCAVRENFTQCQLPPTSTKRTNGQGITTQGRLVVYISNMTVTNVPAIRKLADNQQHSRALRGTRGLYTAEKLAKFDAESFDYYAKTFGPCFNFTGVPYNPTFYNIGAYLSPCGALVPYVIGIEDSDPNNLQYHYKVAFDSSAINKGATGRHRNVAVGNLVLVFVPSVTTPAGILYVNDVLGFADYTQVDLSDNDWSKDHETLRIATPFASKQIITQFPLSNLQANLSPLRIFDDCCNAGFGQITSTYSDADFWSTGTLQQYLTMTVYWP